MKVRELIAELKKHDLDVEVAFEDIGKDYINRELPIHGVLGKDLDTKGNKVHIF